MGRLDLLPQLYTDIWIPDLVLAEYQANMAAGDPIRLSTARLVRNL